MTLVQLAPPGAASPLTRLVDDYLTHCRARGLSPATDIAYSQSLQRVLLPWCAEQGVNRVEGLDRRTLDRLSADLLTRTSARGKRLSSHSVHTYTRGIRQFLAWAQREGELVAAKPQLPKRSKLYKDVLSADEIDALEAAVTTERNRIIIRVLADCGLREGEVVRLRTSSILRPDNRGELHVEGKGRRERRVPVMPRLRRRIERYVESRPLEVSTDRLFVGLRRGLSGDYEPLTESGVRQLVRDAGRRLGLSRQVNPHLLRHSWMTEMLRQGMDPVQLSLIAGASLKVIMDHYQHLNQDDAHAAMARALTARDNRGRSSRAT
jgi:integrase/recombinase XerD